MNQDFYVKFALFVPVLVSHIQSASSDGSSKLSRGSANYHLESALLPMYMYIYIYIYKKLKLEVKEELLKVPDPWMLEPIKALLAEYEL